MIPPVMMPQVMPEKLEDVKDEKSMALSPESLWEAMHVCSRVNETPAPKPKKLIPRISGAIVAVAAHTAYPAAHKIKLREKERRSLKRASRKGDISEAAVNMTSLMAIGKTADILGENPMKESPIFSA